MHRSRCIPASILLFFFYFMLEGVGPRLLPVDEDKVCVSAAREANQHLPRAEGLDDDTGLYPTASRHRCRKSSVALLRTILASSAASCAPGYAIEYD